MLALGLAFSILFSRQEQEQPPKPPKPPAEAKSSTLKFGSSTEVDVNYFLRYDQKALGHCLACVNLCNGSDKHKRHEDCDSSCDERCKATHAFNDSPMYLSSSDPVAQENVRKAMSKLGADVGGEWNAKHIGFDFVGGATKYVAPILKDAANAVKLKLTHWNNDPCTLSYKEDWELHWTVLAHWQVFRVETREDGTKVRVAGPTGDANCGTVYTYTFDAEAKPFLSEFCRCKILLTPEEAEFHELIEKLLKKKKEEEEQPRPTGKISLPGVHLEPIDSCMGPVDLKTINFSVECQDLDTAVCSADNPLPYAIDVCVDPGTMCVPEDSSYQAMLFVMPLKMHLPPKGQGTYRLALEHGPHASHASVKAEGRIACIEMHKKQPRAGVAYHLDAIGDVNLLQLANMVQDEAIIGSHDQARLWIYTDHTDYEGIKKLLIPAPPAGQYAALCYDVMRKAGADFGSDDYKGCLDPSTIFAKGRTSPAAAAWYVGMCDQVDPAKLAEKVPGEGSDLVALLGNELDNFAPKRIALTLNELCGSEHEPVALAGLELLKGVPAEKRQQVIDVGGMSGVCVALGSADAEVEAAALDVVEAYGYSAAYPYVYTLSTSAADAGVKARAAALCKALLK